MSLTWLHNDGTQRSRQLLIILAFGFSASIFASDLDERIWLPGAMVNGKPVQLCFDTGSSHSALFVRTVEKLGLKFTAPPPNDFGMTEKCTLTLQGNNIEGSLVVLNPPQWAETNWDGLIGWVSLKDNILGLDASEGEIWYWTHRDRENFTATAVLRDILGQGLERKINGKADVQSRTATR